MSSPAYSIITQCVAQAQANIDLTGVGSAPGIPDEHVLALNLPYSTKTRDRLPSLPRPSLIFSIARHIDTPLSAGDNRKLVAFYTVVAQILHTDLFLQDADVMQSVMQWTRNIQNYFHAGNLRQAADTDDWKITLAVVGKIEQLEDAMLHAFDDAVAVIPITFKSTEMHSATGRT